MLIQTRIASLCRPLPKASPPRQTGARNRAGGSLTGPVSQSAGICVCIGGRTNVVAAADTSWFAACRLEGAGSGDASAVSDFDKDFGSIRDLTR